MKTAIVFFIEIVLLVVFMLPLVFALSWAWDREAALQFHEPTAHELGLF